jgi:hypothetical protein
MLFSSYHANIRQPSSSPSQPQLGMSDYMQVVHMLWIRTWILAAGVFVSGAARAQTLEEPRGGARFNPSFRTEFVYDDNLFFSAGSEETSAPYLAFSPGLQVTHRARRFSLDGSLSGTSELFFNELESLSEALARGQASAGIQITPNERTSLSVRGDYVSTLRPGELIPDTGLELGRQRGNGASGLFSFSRLTSLRTAVTFQYDLSRTELESETNSSADNLEHNVTARWSLNTSVRGALNVSYNGRLYQYMGRGTRSATRIDLADSHLFFVGALRQLGRRVSVQLGAGPRLTNEIDSGSAEQAPEPSYRSRVVPEVLAGISYNSRSSQYSAAYTRRQNQTFGSSGLVNTESVSFTVSLRPHPSFLFGLSPAVFRDTRAEQAIRSFTVLANGSLNLSNWIRVDGAYSFRRQDGDFLLGTEAQHFRTRNTVTLSFVLGKGTSSF